MGRRSALLKALLKSPISPWSSILLFFECTSKRLGLLAAVVLYKLSLSDLRLLHANMPIISSVGHLTTAIATCTVTRPSSQDPAPITSGFAKLAKRELLWSHSEVFVTPFGTLTTLEHPNVPDLTTIHTPASSCVDRWVMRPSQSCGGDSGTADIVWSVNPTRSIVSDPSYTGCQLYGKATYSPGICPSGQTIAEVTAFESSVSTGTRTFWKASCCRRYSAIASPVSVSELTYLE